VKTSAQRRGNGEFWAFGIAACRPTDGWPNFRLKLLRPCDVYYDNAKLYGTTEEAVADLELVYATCCRMRDMEKRCLRHAN